MSEQIQRQIAEAQQRAERAQQFAAHTNELRGTGSSARGEVDVTVDQAGRLVDIAFGAEALRATSADALRRLVLQATAAAQARVHEQAMEMAAEAFGEDSQTTRMIRDSFPQPSVTEDDDDTFRGSRGHGLA